MIISSPKVINVITTTVIETAALKISETRTRFFFPTSWKDRANEENTVVGFSGFPIHPGACRLSNEKAGTVSETRPYMAALTARARKTQRVREMATTTTLPATTRALNRLIRTPRVYCTTEVTTYCRKARPNIGQNRGREVLRVVLVVVGAYPSPSTVCRLTRDRIPVIHTRPWTSSSPPARPIRMTNTHCTPLPVVLPRNQ